MEIIVLYEGELTDDQLKLINKLNEKYRVSIDRFNPTARYTLPDALKVAENIKEYDCIIFMYVKNIEDYDDKEYWSSVSAELLSGKANIIECYPGNDEKSVLEKIEAIEKNSDENKLVFPKFPKLSDCMMKIVRIIWFFVKAGWVLSMTYAIMQICRYLVQ